MQIGTHSGFTPNLNPKNMKIKKIVSCLLATLVGLLFTSCGVPIYSYQGYGQQCPPSYPSRYSQQRPPGYGQQCPPPGYSSGYSQQRPPSYPPGYGQPRPSSGPINGYAPFTGGGSLPPNSGWSRNAEIAIPRMGTGAVYMR